MAPDRDLAPRSQLRRVGAIGLMAGLVFVTLAAAGWALFSQASQSPATEEVIVVSLVGFLGLAAALTGSIALTAASRFPVVSHMAGPSDFLTFLGVALTAAGTVALVTGESPAFAMVPIGALGSLLLLSAGLRKILRSPAARAPGDA